MNIRPIHEYKIIHPSKGEISYYDDLNDARKRILEDLQLPDNLAFLDVGTGDGWFAIEAVARLSRGLICSIELSPEESQWAKNRAREFGHESISFLSMDAYRMAFANSSFDVVASFLAVQDICPSIEDLQRLTTEIARVLRPNGIIVIATITPEDAETESQQLGIELYQFIRAGYFSKTELEQALRASGFELEPFRFYHTGVNLSLDAALEFIKFQCGWWVDTFQMPTVDWRTTWEKFRPRMESLGGLEVEAKITVALARKKS
jgi:SAM-dependent methyltransferase